MPEAVLLENLPQKCFAAGVDIGGVKIVHAAFYSSQNFLLGLIVIYFTAFLGKAHTAIAQGRDIIPVFILTIFHSISHHFLLMKISYNIPARNARRTLAARGELC